MPEPKIKCDHCGSYHQKRELKCPKCSYVSFPHLYKYVPFNQYSLAILINKEVWFSKAIDVNDPFEFIFRLTKMEMFGQPVNKESLEIARKQAMELGVFCLSDVKDDILMWSHYAEKHTGFCIEFERNDQNYFKPDTCIPIIYPEDNEILLIDNDALETHETFSKIATTKSKHWTYENEWRIVSKEIGGKTHPLPGDISGIIFGCRMSAKDRDTIINILNDQINYYEAIESDSEYKLNIKVLGVLK